MQVAHLGDGAQDRLGQAKLGEQRQFRRQGRLAGALRVAGNGDGQIRRRHVGGDFANRLRIHGIEGSSGTLRGHAVLLVGVYVVQKLSRMVRVARP